MTSSTSGSLPWLLPRPASIAGTRYITSLRKWPIESEALVQLGDFRAQSTVSWLGVLPCNTIRIRSTPTFLYYDLYFYSASVNSLSLYMERSQS